MKSLPVHLPLAIVALALLICGCKQPVGQSHTPQEADSIPTKPLPLESTAYPFPNLALPDGWEMGAMDRYDSLDAADYHANFPQMQAPGAGRINADIQDAIAARIAYEATFVDPQPIGSYAPQFTFDMRPTDMFQQAGHLSITFVIDTYGEGGNHHNYSWYALNYDLERQRRLEMGDVFLLRSRADSVAFAACVERHGRPSGCVTLEPPFHDLAWAMRGDSIKFLPYSSWACSEATATVPLDSLRPYLR